MLKKLFNIVKIIFPVSAFVVLFDNDAHSIVSKKGWKVINKKL